LFFVEGVINLRRFETHRGHFQLLWSWDRKTRT